MDPGFLSILGDAVTQFTTEALFRAKEIQFEFYRATGPGGQNVNKVSTAVRLRFDVRRSRLLPEAVKERLARLAGRRLTDAGVLVIEAQRFRTQERNRHEALERLLGMIQGLKSRRGRGGQRGRQPDRASGGWRRRGGAAR